ncbi:ABC transporter permease, partial [Candidatus Geothermarchaeota archaeon]
MEIKRRESYSIWSKAIFTTLSILLTFLIASSLIIQAGVNPFYAYYHLFHGALGDKLALTETLVKFCPLLLCGLSVSIAFLCKFWNIGAEGQLYLGGLVSALFGVYFAGAPSYLIIPLMISSGFLAGASWAAIPAYLKARLNVDEVVTTLLGNWIVYFATSAILYGPWKNPVTGWPESPPIIEASRLPKLVPGTRLHLGVVFAIIIAVIYYVIYNKTMWGLELKAIGSNPRAAEIRGIKVFRNFILAAILSGGIAGLAGVFEVAGIY